MVQCAACGKFLRKGVVCPGCRSTSHHECVRLPAGAQVSDSWRCGACQATAPKGRDPSTPVRAANQEYSAAAPLDVSMLNDTATHDTALSITADFEEQELHVQLTSLRSEMLAEFQTMHRSVAADLASFKREFSTMFAEMREFRTEMSELRAAVSALSGRMDGLERRLEAVERRGAEPASAEVAALERAVADLRGELNDRDQEALLADLEVGQLPEERGESVVHAVTVLAAKLGVHLEERDVVFAERVGVAQGAGIVGEGPRPRRVVVRLARRELRDRLLQGARVRRTLTAADAGRADAAPRIFLNERLSRHNRQLFHRAREECRRRQWRFAWTKRGRVYVRQADGKDAYPIRSEADLVRVFGPLHGSTG